MRPDVAEDEPVGTLAGKDHPPPVESAAAPLEEPDATIVSDLGLDDSANRKVGRRPGRHIAINRSEYHADHTNIFQARVSPMIHWRLGDRDDKEG